jgi:hypothetical protein
LVVARGGVLAPRDFQQEATMNVGDISVFVSSVGEKFVGVVTAVNPDATVDISVLKPDHFGVPLSAGMENHTFFDPHFTPEPVTPPIPAPVEAPVLQSVPQHPIAGEIKRFPDAGANALLQGDALRVESDGSVTNLADGLVVSTGAGAPQNEPSVG